MILITGATGQVGSARWMPLSQPAPGFAHLCAPHPGLRDPKVSRFCRAALTMTGRSRWRSRASTSCCCLAEIAPLGFSASPRARARLSCRGATHRQTVRHRRADIVPYALRHSSIVRQLRAGLPVRCAAALHDTSAADDRGALFSGNRRCTRQSGGRRGGALDGRRWARFPSR